MSPSGRAAMLTLWASSSHSGERCTKRSTTLATTTTAMATGASQGGAAVDRLTAAYQLAKAGHTSTVLEADSVVGGISRTVERDGWRFDIGGHRFFTKVKPVENLWHEILEQDEFLQRPRKSHIYYRGKFYDYPIKPLNALRNLGPVEAVRCVGSYLWARVRPPKDRSTLEGYVVANYGWRLYFHFFKTYNEKVWGVPASELSADWGAQRIKGMSLFQAVWEPIRSRVAGRQRDRSRQVTSLIEEFQYPRYGPGMMWERCQETVQAAGTKVIMDTAVTRIRHEGGRAVSVVAESEGVTTEYPADEVISSMPFSLLLRAMDPPVPPEVQRAADALAFRDFLTVALVVPADKVPWDDTWIYIHAPEVKTMRVQKAYPVYDEHYKGNVDVLRAWLSEHTTNVHPVGRNGMHRYNNQDHSMYTAMLTVENIVGGAEHDIWSVNVEDEYHEEASPRDGSGARGTGRDAPVLPRRPD